MTTHESETPSSDNRKLSGSARHGSGSGLPKGPRRWGARRTIGIALFLGSSLIAASAYRLATRLTPQKVLGARLGMTKSEVQLGFVPDGSFRETRLGTETGLHFTGDGALGPSSGQFRFTEGRLSGIRLKYASQHADPVLEELGLEELSLEGLSLEPPQRARVFAHRGGHVGVFREDQQLTIVYARASQPILPPKEPRPHPIQRQSPRME